MENDILEFVKSPVSLSFIAKRLKISRNETNTIIRKLMGEGKIFFDAEFGLYSVVQEGIISIKKRGFGFITTPDSADDYYVDTLDTLESFNNDKVKFAEIISDGRRLKAAKVLGIIEHSHKEIIGRLVARTFKERVKYTLVSDDDDFNATARILEADLNGAIPGNVCIAKLDYSRRDLFGKITTVIGNKNDPSIEISEIAYKHGFSNEFSEGTINELKELPDEVRTSDLLHRVDYTSLNVITIDGDDSKDFDDAVSLEILSNGNYLLHVFIADVSHYVTVNSSIDVDAYKRGTSVYLADRVLPMLLPKLSNGICSLNEGVIRLVLACNMELNARGSLVNYSVEEAYIKSLHRMTYNNVNKMLTGDQETITKYKDIYDMIIQMNDFAKILREIRYKKGGLEFEVDEYKISLNEQGKPTAITLRTRDMAEMLIEDFMLKANEVIAYHLSIMNLPCMYRIHEKPDQEKLQKVFLLIKNLGYSVKPYKNDIRPAFIQDALESISDDSSKALINSMILRAMMKAKYSSKNSGHYGLALEYYCHFTSPIRRYPDLVIHRLLKHLIIHPENYLDDYKFYQENLEEMAMTCSTQEKLAVECERETNDMLFAWYMEQYVGKKFNGIITSITGFGMFITLKNGIEGLVSLTTMDDYYTFDENNMVLSSGSKSFHLGDKVSIVVLNSSKRTRKIDFILESDYNISRSDNYENRRY